jgi:hypothetical protein
MADPRRLETALHAARRPFSACWTPGEAAVQASADEDEDQTMKILRRPWHSLICGCHKEEHRRLWSGWARVLFPLLTALSVG